MMMPRLEKATFLLTVFCVASALAARAQTVSTILTFTSSTGGNANALTQGTNGNFYGTAEQYGKNMSGTAYEMAPAGNLTEVYSFCSQPNCADGGGPVAPLLLAGDGNFYGTTNGATVGLPGTVFKVGTGGQLTTLYSFCSLPNCADGSNSTVLVEGRDGNLYGITAAGDTGNHCNNGNSGCGTFFKITKTGALTTLHNFCTFKTCADGSFPGTLMLATDGTFYGTALEGGTSSACGIFGCGVLFRMKAEGTLLLAYSFSSALGSEPNGVIEGSDGNFYGTTLIGGANDQGIVFQYTSSGTLNDLHDFCGTSRLRRRRQPGGRVGAGHRRQLLRHNK